MQGLCVCVCLFACLCVHLLCVRVCLSVCVCLFVCTTCTPLGENYAIFSFIPYKVSDHLLLLIHT